ncbi:hypothetical protein GCM10009733_021210 [Nonomuraea maheshkhaliensis]|uniref:DUF317 domain-containing protein n=1 Tax=Nonomuraea maheshkhaliensis TaxID=419590 RepID=A0ABP4QYD5_9ACTN
MIDRDPPHDRESHTALAAEDAAASPGATWSPNRTSQQIITRLEKEGFAVKVPDAPHGSAWQLVLDKPGERWLGVLWVSKRKGRPLRASITWHPEDQPYQTRKAEGTRAIRDLINQVTPHGWERRNA